MNPFDIFWVVIFSVFVIWANVIGYCAKHYLNNKPLGSKSLQDGVFKDSISVGQFFVTAFSFISVMSRFEDFRSLVKDSQSLLTGFCALYIFAYISVMINQGLQCITRILCIVNMSFVEESIGENVTQNFVTVTTVVVSGSACIFFYVVGDINTGTAASLFTSTTIPTGKLSLYLLLISTSF